MKYPLIRSVDGIAVSLHILSTREKHAVCATEQLWDRPDHGPGRGLAPEGPGPELTRAPQGLRVAPTQMRTWRGRSEEQVRALGARGEGRGQWVP